MPCNTYGRKLIFIWQGPYEVKEMKNPKVAILKNVLSVDDDWTVEMHVSKLKYFRGAGAHLLDQWCQQSAYDGNNLVIEDICNFRVIESTEADPKPKVEFLIKWMRIRDPTWETSDAVVDKDPEFIHRVVVQWARDRRYTAANRKALKAFLKNEFAATIDSEE